MFLVTKGSSIFFKISNIQIFKEQSFSKGRKLQHFAVSLPCPLWQVEFTTVIKFFRQHCKWTLADVQEAATRRVLDDLSGEGRRSDFEALDLRTMIYMVSHRSLF